MSILGNFFGDKGRKTWKMLSFSKRATRQEILLREQILSHRFTRLGIALCSIVFSTFVIGAGQDLSELLSFAANENNEWIAWGQLAGIVFVIHFAMFLLIRAYHREVLASAKSFTRYFIVLSVFLIVAKLMLLKGSEEFLLPLPVFAAILALVFRGPLAVSTSVALISMVLLMEVSDSAIVKTQLAAAQFLGSLVAILGVQRIRNRTRLVTIGFYSGLVQFVSISVFSFGSDYSTVDLALNTLSSPGMGFINGLGTGIIITSALPFIERIFDVTTDVRLIELADQNNPLLRQFSLLAPGSFMHSLMVGQLSEEAAQSIGANDLLARVGAYYHDIGKMLKPNYFVENVGDGENIHDRLSPEMSRLIIIAHVKDGIRIANEEKLPKPIIDMIPMHHGTSVVEYFYHKKRQQEEVHGLPESGEAAFQYPGPKPTFREAGILMLADTTEAISRVLSDPTPTRLRQVVRNVINKKMTTGQLDECQLTMQDLKKIEDAFVRVLAAIHHGRIKYPSDDVLGETKTKDADSKKDQTKLSNGRRKSPTTNSESKDESSKDNESSKKNPESTEKNASEASSKSSEVGKVSKQQKANARTRMGSNSKPGFAN